MMRIAFDTNVLIDALSEREGTDVARKLVMAVAEERAVGIVSANSITDIYYIIRKHLGDEATRLAIWNILSLFDVATVDGEACATALNLQMKDFEDAVLAVCAEREGAEYIATRDQELIRCEYCPLEAYRPEEILNMLQGE